MKSNRGPDAIQPPPNYANDSNYYKSRESSSYDWAKNKNTAVNSGVGGSWATTAPAPHQAAPSISVNQGPSVVPSVGGGGGTAVSDGSYEKQLIMELCPPGGMKPEPPSDKLAQFSRTVSSLNSDLVCPVLLDCLEEGQPWIIRAKALWVMLACIQHGKKPGAPSNAYADFFRECHAEIAPLSNHNRTAIRDPAKRILNLLGVATPVQGVAAAPVAATPDAMHEMVDAPVVPARGRGKKRKSGATPTPTGCLINGIAGYGPTYPALNAYDTAASEFKPADFLKGMRIQEVQS